MKNEFYLLNCCVNATHARISLLFGGKIARKNLLVEVLKGILLSTSRLREFKESFFEDENHV
jgi:hypothetical protein